MPTPLKVDLSPLTDAIFHHMFNVVIAIVIFGAVYAVVSLVLMGRVRHAGRDFLARILGFAAAMAWIWDAFIRNPYKPPLLGTVAPPRREAVDFGQAMLDTLLHTLEANKTMFGLVAVVLAIAFVVKLFRARIKGAVGELSVKRVLDKAGVEHFHDVYLPSRGGVTQIDHIALVGGAILVIETKNYEGAIYGEADQAQWTVSFAGGNVKHRFQNPIRQNFGHEKAVQAVVGPDVDVLGLVVFTGGAKFPKGVPDGVIDVDDLRSRLKSLIPDHPASAMTAMAWTTLETAISGSDRKQDKAAHRRTIAARKAAPRTRRT